ncbi:hypothetical protein P9112_007837 [Eukaryota sp. TZLM1-RC]
MVGDTQRVLENPLNGRNELIRALDKLSREMFGCNAERRPRISGMGKRIKEIMPLPIKDRLDWKASFLDQYGRIIRFLFIEQRSRTDSEDILQSKLPAWFNPNFDTEIHSYTELTEGAPTYIEEFIEQEDSSELLSVETREEPLNTNAIPEKHEREGLKFCTFCSNVKGNNPVGHTVFECKDPRCARSRAPKEERFSLGEQETPASRGSVDRGRGSRGRRVNRFRGRGGRFSGHKGRGQYSFVYNTNITEDISSNTSPTESDLFDNRNSRTSNFPDRVHINAINHKQSTTDLANPVNNFPTAQQNLLIPLQIHQTCSDINSIFDINSTFSGNHIRYQRSPFLRLEISINDIEMIATIDSAAFCSVITADIAEQCHSSINSKDTIQILPADNVST